MLGLGQMQPYWHWEGFSRTWEDEIRRRPRDEPGAAYVGRVRHAQEHHGAVRLFLCLANPLPRLQNSLDGNIFSRIRLIY